MIWLRFSTYLSKIKNELQLGELETSDRSINSSIQYKASE